MFRQMSRRAPSVPLRMMAAPWTYISPDGAPGKLLGEAQSAARVKPGQLKRRTKSGSTPVQKTYSVKAGQAATRRSPQRLKD